jgi:hypothetical protein
MQISKDYTVYVYRKDKRCKSGERLYSVNVVKDTTESVLQTLYNTGYYASDKFTKKYRIEFIPTMKTVVNLMTGEKVQIEHDTPRSCDPSTELYWRM